MGMMEMLSTTSGAPKTPDQKMRTAFSANDFSKLTFKDQMGN